MNVLVTVASKHDSTYEIGAEIGRVLAQRGLDVELMRVEDVGDLDGYDAIVLGSAVYMGKWLEAAHAFVGQHSDALSRRPTWVFSSGPIGDPPRPAPEPGKEVIALPAAVRANDHGVFAGKLDPGRLGLRERTIVRAVRAPAGDFREWARIDFWAEEIADRLAAGCPPG